MYQIRDKWIIDPKIVANAEAKLLQLAKFNIGNINDLWTNDRQEHSMHSHMLRKFLATTRFTPDGDPVLFFTSCDPSNQKMICDKYELEICETYNMIIFFQWIKCSLGAHDIMQLFNDTVIVEQWRNLNSIIFFFELELFIRTKLVNEYNMRMNK